MRPIAETCSLRPPADHAELSYLLGREGLRVAGWEEISAMKTRYRHRTTYRLCLEDGRILKGRQVRRPIQARRMQQLLPRVPSPNVASVLAVHRHAVLEQWVEGPRVDQLPQSEALLSRAGRLLSAFHRGIEVRPVARHGREMGDLVREFGRAVSALRRRSLVAPSRAHALLEQALRSVPERAHWGLVHRDFCADNLVVRRENPCAIDNVTVRLGFLEEDLARWCYRWPMLASQRARFLSGYAAASDPEPFLRNQRFWMLVATVLAAASRLKSGSTDLAAPCRELHHWSSHQWASVL